VTTGIELAEIAYRAYAESRNGKTWDGRDMSPWVDLGDPIRSAWAAAAEAVRAEVGPKVTLTPEGSAMSVHRTPNITVHIPGNHQEWV
jgi:hypothetical protein